ncbi:hypothetical protein [Rhodovarius crocodyli]|uniref:hypothetical protein n=1 Tax=Rhodovarius crocodyli TaxID=1979269 RepID=UPI000FD923E4|nr:hypothetical protein [Rhodovarius crocodyli]
MRAHAALALMGLALVAWSTAAAFGPSGEMIAFISTLVCCLLAVLVLPINGPAADPACPARARPISQFRRPDPRLARKFPPRRAVATGNRPDTAGHRPV